jgi:hypothetical protein
MDHRIYTKLSNVQNNPKVNVFYAVSRTQICRPFFFTATIIMGHVYLDMLEHFVIVQLDVNRMIWEQDGAHPHYHRDVTWYLNHTFQGRWIGYVGYILWPHRSPDLTPMDFSLWAIHKR